MKKNHKILKILAVLLILVVILAAAGYYYLKSSAFDQFALRKIIEQADQATGGRTQIQAFDFNLPTLTAHLYNIVMRGKESSQDPPLLQADELTVTLKIDSVLHRKITLRELLIEHPVVHLQVDRSGNSNLPQPPPSKSNSHTSVFDLAVGHAALTNGEVNYNDSKIPLDADLYNLGANITFNSLATRYQGTVSYDRGRLRYGHYAPWPHNFSAKFNATPSRFALESAVMRIASSTVSLRADVANYENLVVVADYKINLHGPDLNAISSMKAQGDLAVSGNMHYQQDKKRPLLRSVVLTGVVNSNALSATSSSGRLEMRNLQGKYELANGSFNTDGLKADLLDGHVEADVYMRDLDRTPTSRVRATLRSLSLQALQQAVRSAASRQVSVSGVLDD